MAEMPDYVVTRHSRAKHIRLSVDTLGKVKVTAPRRISSSVIHEFVKENLDWIKSVSLRQKDPRLSHPDLSLSIPQKITLKSIDQSFYTSTLFSNKNFCDEKSNFLYLYGSNEQQHLDSLRSWLKSRAKEFLIQRLTIRANLMDLEYNKVYIKNQKTRWGSCSNRKNINLNQNLIFFDMALVDYLLIHELSHLRYPNHSTAFWQHVEKYDAYFKQHDKALNKASKQIPLWALPS